MYAAVSVLLVDELLLQYYGFWVSRSLLMRWVLDTSLVTKQGMQICGLCKFHELLFFLKSKLICGSHGTIYYTCLKFNHPYFRAAVTAIGMLKIQKCLYSVCLTMLKLFVSPVPSCLLKHFLLVCLWSLLVPYVTASHLDCFCATWRSDFCHGHTSWEET